MTGFGRAETAHLSYAWSWEGRSVNGKSLDIRCRLPAGFEALEPVARAAAGDRFKRGNIALTLTATRTESATRLRLNRDLVDEVLALAREIEDAGGARPRLDSLLAIKGVVEPVEEEDPAEHAAVVAAMTASLTDMLDRLATARAEEGRRLEPVLTRLMGDIEGLVAAAASSAAAGPEALRVRLRAQLAELLEAAPPLPEDRLAQEAALLIGKADVREELDRLTAHIAQARDLLTDGGAVGRRLDFLCQEFNREANTLCSKSADVALTRIGLDLKAVIEQFREQIQNIE
ncbi:MAG: YicC/YloC family endoribonuclease [Inquilinaceae bacterium]